IWCKPTGRASRRSGTGPRASPSASHTAIGRPPRCSPAPTCSRSTKSFSARNGPRRQRGEEVLSPESWGSTLAQGRFSKRQVCRGRDLDAPPYGYGAYDAAGSNEVVQGGGNVGFSAERSDALDVHGRGPWQPVEGHCHDARHRDSGGGFF